MPRASGGMTYSVGWHTDDKLLLPLCMCKYTQPVLVRPSCHSLCVCLRKVHWTRIVGYMERNISANDCILADNTFFVDSSSALMLQTHQNVTKTLARHRMRTHTHTKKIVATMCLQRYRENLWRDIHKLQRCERMAEHYGKKKFFFRNEPRDCKTISSMLFLKVL